MTDANRCPDPEALLVLMYDDEGEPDERAALAAHVASCGACAHVVGSLDQTRGMLGAWHAPRMPLGFALVQESRPSFGRQFLYKSGLAAAAVLVLAAASSLAQIEVRYDANGFALRTGASQAAPAAASAAAPDPAPAAGRQLTAGPPNAQYLAQVASGDSPWRADLELLSTQLRYELARQAEQIRAARMATPVVMTAAAVPAQTGPRRTLSDEELVKRVQDLLDQSEVRQQQNLALRVTEIGRQFELQRQADIVQVEQTLTRIEQQRNELLRRVSATQPRP
ncbi:MAG TPA: hypothetical protein VMF13_16010 [Luteitalea sp.]|nr:hypothetical protein [Luteitalea sp.]